MGILKLVWVPDDLENDLAAFGSEALAAAAKKAMAAEAEAERAWLAALAQLRAEVDEALGAGAKTVKGPGAARYFYIRMQPNAGDPLSLRVEVHPKAGPGWPELFRVSLHKGGRQVSSRWARNTSEVLGAFASLRPYLKEAR